MNSYITVSDYTLASSSGVTEGVRSHPAFEKCYCLSILLKTSIGTA